MCICIHTCIALLMYNMYIYIHTYIICTHMHVYSTYSYTYINNHIFTRQYVRICHMSTSKCTHMNTHTTHVHTHTRKYIHILHSCALNFKYKTTAGIRTERLNSENKWVATMPFRSALTCISLSTDMPNR